LPDQGVKWLGSYRGESQIWTGHIRSIKIVSAWLLPKKWKQVTEIPDYQASFCTDVGKLEVAVRGMFGLGVVRAR